MASKVFLRNEVSLQDLERGCEIEIPPPVDDSSSDESFDDENFNAFKQEIADIEGKLKPRIIRDALVPFSALKASMTPITDDGLVLKEVIKYGSGIVIPEKSVVMMHYDAYIENQKDPFDSTRLRNKVFKFLFGEGNLLPGLELGIKTMKKEEISRFIVGSAYAFGTMGCPPRIPGNADILYEVEIINFYESKDVIEFEEMTPEDQKKAPFEKIANVYRCETQMGNDLFRKKMYRPAVARYRRVVGLLEDVSVVNEEDDDKRKSYLLKLYINLSQCYLALQNPQKAIIYSDLALKLNNKSVKALFNMGCALNMTDEYERAHYYLNQAKKHKPYEKCINRIMSQLDKKRRLHSEWERSFCRKMFGSGNEEEKKCKESPETLEFRSVLAEELETFLDSDKAEYMFSSGYTESEIDVVKDLSKKYGLAFVSKIQNDNKIIKVAKKHLPS